MNGIINDFAQELAKQGSTGLPCKASCSAFGKIMNNTGLK